MLLNLACALAHGAETHSSETHPVGQPGWLIGLGYISAPNPFVADVDTVDTLIPLLGYMGERLTWLGPYLSYEIVNGRRVSVAAVIETRFEGIPEDVEDGPLAGLDARRLAVEAGGDVAYGRFIGSVRADVSGRHNGYEVSLAVREERYLGESWRIEGRIGAAWQDADLTSYFYGVETADSTPTLPVYQPEAALNYEASLFVSCEIGRRWMALGSVAFRHLDDEISSSPMVAGDHDLGGFVGIVYRFGR